MIIINENLYNLIFFREIDISWQSSFQKSNMDFQVTDRLIIDPFLTLEENLIEKIPHIQNKNSFEMINFIYMLTLPAGLGQVDLKNVNSAYSELISKI